MLIRFKASSNHIWAVLEYLVLNWSTQVLLHWCTCSYDYIFKNVLITYWNYWSKCAYIHFCFIIFQVFLCIINLLQWMMYIILLKYFAKTDHHITSLCKHPLVKTMLAKFNTDLPASASVDKIFSLADATLLPRWILWKTGDAQKQLRWYKLNWSGQGLA